MSLAVECNLNCLAAVSALLKCSCPTAITWLVIAIVVYAVYGVGESRAFAHISEKVSEVSPPLTHRDSASAIILKPAVVYSVAPPKHCAPTPVRRCPWATPARVSMFGHPDSGNLVMQTAARSRCSVSQRASLDRFLRPTLAPAQPVRFFLPGWGNRGVRIPEDRKPAEHATSEINQSRHRTISEGKSHREGNGAATRRWLRVSGATLAAPHISIPQKPSLENTTFGVRDG